MVKLTMYRSNDGKLFESAQECLEHEQMLEDFSNALNNSVTAFDYDGLPISFENKQGTELEQELWQIKYIMFHNTKAASLFLSYVSKMPSPYRDAMALGIPKNQIFVPGDVYFRGIKYYSDAWLSVIEERQDINSSYGVLELLRISNMFKEKT